MNMSSASYNHRRRNISSSTPPTAQFSPAPLQWTNNFQSKLSEKSSVYQALQLVKARGRNDPDVSADFDRRKQNNQQSFSMPQAQYRDQFLDIFTDINSAVGRIFVDNKVQVFLDLGCAPGGFSKFILDNNSQARGMGITLPTIPMVRDGALMKDSRYHVVEGDLTQLNFDATSFCLPSARIELEKDGYDLIIAGAFPTGQRMSAADRAILALSQLHAILSNMKPGGTAVVLASTKEFLWNAEMLAALRRVFVQIQPAKHAKLHAIRSSCYFVCTGFKADVVDEFSFKGRVKAALAELKMPQSEDANKLLIFDGLYTAEMFFTEESRHFLDLMEPLWSKQCEAIKQKIRKTRRGSL
ncbi:hypothetical protein HWV62_572 [Athelia sp. TMB]|nr:hypothetical protein HWV62_572 [Athelia sp. TMB]